jgi:hypothetical protein
MEGSTMEGFPKVPLGWGDDPLSKFIQGTTDNTYATFHNLKGWYNCLRDIHASFSDATQNMDRTQDWFASFFLFRAHSAYLAGTRLALSGQVPEAYMVLRGVLESALYGFYVARNSSVRETWLRRNEDKATKKRMRQDFKIANIFQILELEDQKLRKIAGDLYERTIDYGGHPNQQAFLSVMKQQSDESKITFQSAYMIGNEDALHLCLKSCAQIGICALSIFRLVFRERFDILGISQNLDEVKRGL